MQDAQREALAALRLTWAPTTDDLWRAQTTHVAGFNEDAIADVMAAFADAVADPSSAPLGVVIQGPAGSGKTHLLGQIRERVQARSGYFFVVELLDAASFWQSVRGGIVDSLGRPGATHETQLKDLLWELSSIAHIPRADRRAIVGDDDLDPATLDGFVNALAKAHPDPVRKAHQTLRALVLLGATDLTACDVGEAYLLGNDEFDRASADTWGLRPSALTAQETVREISRLVAVAGPAVLALDQIDTLLAQSAARADSADHGGDHNDDHDDDHGGDEILEQVAHGLMGIRQTMRRTVGVVACLPSAWEAVRTRATASVADRFRVTAPLRPLPTPAVGRAILERRFSASYAAVGFAPPYPSWPIAPAAFDEAPHYTPRRLLMRADHHVRECLRTGEVAELQRLGDAAPPLVEPGPVPGDTLAALDRRFAELRRGAVASAALDPDGEDVTVPELLAAALTAWIAERAGDAQSFVADPPPGKQVSLHARLRRSLDQATDDERHWAFRAIASANAVAAQNRMKKAWNATGFGSGSDRRQLFLLRNAPWPSGAKTAALVEEFHSAGGRTLPLSEDDVRTMMALRDLLGEDAAELPQWLRARRPAHRLGLLREALGSGDGDVADDVTDDGVAIDDGVVTEGGVATDGGDATGGAVHDVPAADDVAEPETPRDDETAEPISATTIPVGTDTRTGATVSIDLSALRKHVVIFAGSGSGKTVLIRRIVEECALSGVSSIVLDPNNDLSRLGSAWPEPPPGWRHSDDARAAEYLAGTEVVVWTPRRTSGRPLAFRPLPDFPSVVDDDDEFTEAVESAVAALEPRALITAKTAKAARARAVLREALESYGRDPAPTLGGFVDMLADLPDDVSRMAGAHQIAAGLSQDLSAAMVNDPLFGGAGTPLDPGVLLTPSQGYRARVSVISMIGLQEGDQRQSFVNQLQMALFAWIKHNPAADRPLGGLLVMDEAQNIAPSTGFTASTRSTLALASQARKYGLGLVFATQAPKGLHNQIPGNATTQFYGLLNAPVHINAATEMARAKGGLVPDISRLRAGNFYLASEGQAFHRIEAPWCLSYHPSSPPTAEEVLALARE